MRSLEALCDGGLRWELLNDTLDAEDVWDNPSYLGV